MNRFDAYITDYLHENKEIELEKIGTIKLLSSHSENDAQVPVDFIYNNKATTSEGFIDYISAKTSKSKSLVASDIESHFAQVREFINIGKKYQIPEIGSVKKNNTGVLEFIPYSETNKPARSATPQVSRSSAPANNRSVIQFITVVIVIAILSGLGWQAYRFFTKDQSAQETIAADTSTNNAIPVADTTKTAAPEIAFGPEDSVNVRYIFETTASGLRARTRTAQLNGFGNTAAYDSFVTNSTKYYNLYLIIKTKLADTAKTKDSISKFFLKDVKIVIDSTR